MHYGDSEGWEYHDAEEWFADQLSEQEEQVTAGPFDDLLLEPGPEAEQWIYDDCIEPEDVYGQSEASKPWPNYDHGFITRCLYGPALGKATPPASQGRSK